MGALPGLVVQLPSSSFLESRPLSPPQLMPVTEGLPSAPYSSARNSVAMHDVRECHEKLLWTLAINPSATAFATRDTRLLFGKEPHHCLRPS